MATTRSQATLTPGISALHPPADTATADPAAMATAEAPDLAAAVATEAKDLLPDTARHHLATEAAHRAPAREADTVLLPATRDTLVVGDTEHRRGVGRVHCFRRAD